MFTIPTLDPGNSYTGPTGNGDDNDLCKCNTVVYSLMSACDACQGAKWFGCVRCFASTTLFPGRFAHQLIDVIYRWSTWSHNCSSTDPATTLVPIYSFVYCFPDMIWWFSRYSHTIPSGTTVPAWAFLSISVSPRWPPQNAGKFS